MRYKDPKELSKWMIIGGLIFFLVSLLIIFDVIDIESSGFGLPDDQEYVIGIMFACVSIGVFILGLWFRFKINTTTKASSVSPVTSTNV